MTWLQSAATGSLRDVFALRPNLAEDYASFEAVFREHALLPAALLELVRLRIATLHRCRAELRRRPPGAGRPSQADEKRYQPCLDLAELFVMDPQAMTDEQFKVARDDLGDAGVVALMEVCALYDGYCRFQVILGVDDDV